MLLYVDGSCSLLYRKIAMFSSGLASTNNLSNNLEDTMQDPISTYLDTFPPKTQVILKRVRSKINKNLPEATERISYGIPTYTIDGSNIIHFGGYEHHISLYPGAQVIANFAEKLSKYKTSKGTVQFQLSESVPYDLIEELVVAARQQNSR